MFFLGDTYFYQNKIKESVYDYFLLDISTNKETWDKQYEIFENSPDVEWYDYSNDVIDKEFIDAPAAKESNIPSKEICSDRQDYLDSLAYLIDLSSGDTEKENKSYYTACNDEMYKIYQLCLDKLTGGEKESLVNEQSNWQKNLNKVLSNDEGDIPYTDCADMLFRVK